MIENPKTWFGLTYGEPGEILWPSGLVLIDTIDNEDNAIQEAKRRSALEGKHVRIIILRELDLVCHPTLKVIQGEGLNPMPTSEMAEKKAGIREYLAEKAKKEATP